MKRMTLGQRIALVGCLVVLTFSAALFYFISKGFSKDIEFATWELYGNQYQRPLEELLENLPQHELLARQYLAGSHDPGTTLGDTEGRIDRAFQSLRTVDARLGVALQFTPEGLAKRKREHCRWQTLLAEWNTLKASGLGLTRENSDAAHEHLVADVRTMIVHAGDESNLILDPDLDSYYLMDATLIALPQTQDRIGTIEKLGQDAIGHKLNVAQRMQIAVTAALLKEGDRDRLMGDLETAQNEDSNFHGVSPTLHRNLAPAGEAYAKANDALLTLMGKAAASPRSVSPGEFAAAAQAARRASFNLWQVGVRELDTLLQQRIDDLAGMRLWALIWTVLALTVSATVAGFVIRSATRTLRGMAEQLRGQSEWIAAASHQMAAASQALASGAAEQAASLEQTSSSSEEINSMARRNSEDSRSAAELVTGSHRRFADANHSLEQMVAAIGEINAESDKISSIIRIIDEIAFQTNILALNAAVEAARAGDAGLGFAVVADEVRTLAQRCARAAQDTSALIEQSIAKSNQGRAKVDQVAIVIRAIVEESMRIKALVDHVHLSSQEQRQGVEQVTHALCQMEQVTQRTAATAEESASSAAELQAQAATLNQIVERVTCLVGGQVAIAA